MTYGRPKPRPVRPELVEGPSFRSSGSKRNKRLRQPRIKSGAERFRVSLALITGALLLAGCGLQPLYGGGASGPVAQTLRSVTVAPIEGRAGWLVRTALEDRLGAPKDGSAAYRLEVMLDDDITGFGIRTDDAVTRERRTLRARYRLVDSAKGTVLLDATAGSDAGIDVVGSEYATVAAEQTALERLSREVADQIVTRVALYARRSGEAP
ncbi:MAG TPA: LPS assembly lipoprotein LptE [Allosphingosinicella sp.]|jgi:LPS-assembly lipoprotein